MRYTEDGHKYFVDHNTRSTTFQGEYIVDMPTNDHVTILLLHTDPRTRYVTMETVISGCDVISSTVRQKLLVVLRVLMEWPLLMREISVGKLDNSDSYALYV